MPAVRRFGASLPSELIREAHSLDADADPARSRADKGILRLLLGETEAGVRMLELAVELEPSVDRLSDLTAAYLAQASQSGSAMSLLLALDTASRAVEVDPLHEAAAFNYAVTLDRLHLPAITERAWQEFLELERSGPWSSEASASLDAVRTERQMGNWERAKATLLLHGAITDDQVASVVAQYPDEALRLVEQEIPRLWAEATLAGDAARAQSIHWLARWRQIARSLAEGFGEWLPWDEVTRLGRLTEMPAHATSEVLRNARTWVELADGMRAYQEQRHTAALSRLEPLLPFLADRRSPVSHLAALLTAVCRYYSDVPGTVGELQRLSSRIPGPYPSARARSLWMLGIAAGTERRFEDAIRYYRAALALLQSPSGRRETATLQLLLADAFDSRGEVALGWQYRLGALEQLSRSTEARRRFGGAFDAAQALIRHGRWQLAATFLDEAETNLEEYGVPAGGAELHLERARIFLEQGLAAQTERELAKARRFVESVEVGGLRTRLEANLGVLEAQVRIERDPSDAIHRMREAYRAHKGSGYRVGELDYLASLARAQMLAGESQRATATLVEAVAAYEKTHREAVGLGAKLQAIRQADPVFEQLVRISLERHDTLASQTFEWVERSRARTLSSRLLRGRPAPLPRLEQLGTSLEARTALVAYALTEKDVLAWVVGSDGTTFKRLPEEPQNLATRISSLVNALESGDRMAVVRDRAAQLYDAIIRPLDLDLGQLENLIIVPDGALWRLPFSVLLDSESSDYLVQKTAISLAPSARAPWMRQSNPRRQDSLRLLVVASEGPTSGPYAFLPRLPSVESEAVSIASTIPRSVTLLGSGATLENVLGHLPRHDAIHYAGHAISSRENWQSAGLILSPSADNEFGFLAAPDIAELPLSHLRLVVLAGCRTLSGYDGGREGNLSLGLAFYLAGAHSVVGSLWNIDDQEASEFMRSVYEAMRSTDSPAEALRRAALDQLATDSENGRQSVTWSAFSVLGR